MSVITVTDAAWSKIKENLDMMGAKTIVIGINRRGCNGYSYTYNPKFEPSSNPQSLENDGFYIEVEPFAERYLIGSELDFDGDSQFSKHFLFKNPNATGECGCGESVSF